MIEPKDTDFDAWDQKELSLYNGYITEPFGFGVLVCIYLGIKGTEKIAKTVLNALESGQGDEKIVRVVYEGYQGNQKKPDPVFMDKTNIIVKYTEIKEIPRMIMERSKKAWCVLWVLKRNNSVFKDEMVEYFYQNMKINFLDYYAVFEQMGINENDIDDLLKEKEYDSAYRKAKQRLRVRASAALAQSAMEEKHTPSLSAFLKELKADKKEDDLISDVWTDTGEDEEKYDKPRRGEPIVAKQATDDPMYRKEDGLK